MAQNVQLCSINHLAGTFSVILRSQFELSIFVIGQLIGEKTLCDRQEYCA